MLQSIVARHDTVPALPDVVVLEVSRPPIKNYNYLVVDPGSEQCVLVDPAWQMSKVEQALFASGARLSGVLITHAHPDHTNLAEAFAEKYDCPVWMSRQEIAASGYSTPRLHAITEQPWMVGNLLIQPILTPGHTPGCLCYLIGDSLFTGDVLFAEGCGLCPDVQATHAMFDSLAGLKRRISGSTRIFPGHCYGKPAGQFFADIQRDNIYLHFTDKKSFSAFRLRAGQNKASQFNFR